MAKDNIHFVQWAGQHYVAYLLNRKGYMSSLTLGNAVETDMLVKSPMGETFSVEVKTASEGKNFLRIRRPKDKNTIWFFVTLNIKKNEEPRIVIMKGEDVLKEWNSYYEDSIKKHPDLDYSKKYPITDSSWGIYDNVIQKYESNCWDRLPK